MARVYAGEEVLSRRPVAVKVLRAELAHSEQGRRRFLTEMGILANLDDPHIVRCLLCTEIEGRPVMVLEHLDGWTLRALLDARGALPWTEVVQYAVQIARALHTAHTRRPPIVHRDLKPENVMVLRDGRVKVMDFGIAKILQSMTGATNHEVGTLQYMSPEHIDARPLDGRADLFALGLVMWEMLAGHAPFRGNSPRELLERICTQPTPTLPERARVGLPPHVEAVVFRLLEKQPEARPASAQEVIGLLEPWTRPAPPLRATASSARPAGPSAPPPRSAPPLNTMDIIEDARRSSLDEHVDAIAENINRFASATTSLIVRVLLGLVMLPAGAVLFLGVPWVCALVHFGLLDDDGVDFDAAAPAEPLVGLLISALVATAIVFVRTCWHHRRESKRRWGWKPWLVIGALLLTGSIATVALELAPKSSLPVGVHAFFVIANLAWQMPTMAWVAGRLASRLLRRHEGRA